MIKVEHIETYGWEAAIRGMRNPMNSWEKSDSFDLKTENGMPFIDFIGPNDLALMKKLFKGGTEHRKYLRQIFVSMDITAPLYWWKEFDTYKVGVTANSCSTMHKIAAKEFTIEDFSCEHLFTYYSGEENDLYDECTVAMEDIFDIDEDRTCDLTMNHDVCTFAPSIELLNGIIALLNRAREHYIDTKDKRFWWQMIQLLPTSYNQKRTITMNYENVVTIIKQRTGHKLDEWNDFVDILKDLPCIEDLLSE